MDIENCIRYLDDQVVFSNIIQQMVVIGRPEFRQISLVPEITDYWKIFISVNFYNDRQRFVVKPDKNDLHPLVDGVSYIAGLDSMSCPPLWRICDDFNSPKEQCAEYIIQKLQIDMSHLLRNFASF